MATNCTDAKLETKVSTDASKGGLGAVLLQKHQEAWKPVAYGARSMTEHECSEGMNNLGVAALIHTSNSQQPQPGTVTSQPPHTVASSVSQQAPPQQTIDDTFYQSDEDVKMEGTSQMTLEEEVVIEEQVIEEQVIEDTNLVELEPVLIQPENKLETGVDDKCSGLEPGEVLLIDTEGWDVGKVNNTIVDQWGERKNVSTLLQLYVRNQHKWRDISVQFEKLTGLEKNPESIRLKIKSLKEKYARQRRFNATAAASVRSPVYIDPNLEDAFGAEYQVAPPDTPSDKRKRAKKRKKKVSNPAVNGEVGSSDSTKKNKMEQDISEDDALMPLPGEAARLAVMAGAGVDVLLAYMKEQEERAQRRHDERMAVLSDLVSLLKKNTRYKVQVKLADKRTVQVDVDADMRDQLLKNDAAALLKIEETVRALDRAAPRVPVVRPPSSPSPVKPIVKPETSAASPVAAPSSEWDVQNDAVVDDNSQRWHSLDWEKAHVNTLLKLYTAQRCVKNGLQKWMRIAHKLKQLTGIPRDAETCRLKLKSQKEKYERQVKINDNKDKNPVEINPFLIRAFGPEPQPPRGRGSVKGPTCVSQAVPSAPTCVDQLLSCLENQDQHTQAHQRILEDLQVMEITPPQDDQIKYKVQVQLRDERIVYLMVDVYMKNRLMREDPEALQAIEDAFQSTDDTEEADVVNALLNIDPSQHYTDTKITGSARDWTDEHVNAFLELYVAHKHDKKMWPGFANELRDLTGVAHDAETCRLKMKSLREKYLRQVKQGRTDIDLLLLQAFANS